MHMISQITCPSDLFAFFCGTLSEASDELSTLSSFRLRDSVPLPVITFAADFFLSPACFWVRDFFGIVNSFLLPCLLLPVSVEGDFSHQVRWIKGLPSQHTLLQHTYPLTFFSLQCCLALLRIHNLYLFFLIFSQICLFESTSSLNLSIDGTIFCHSLMDFPPHILSAYELQAILGPFDSFLDHD